MSTREQTEALLAVVDDYRARECRRLLEEAQQEAQALTEQAYTEARRRVHHAVVAERERAVNRVQAAQAELQTARRRHRQRTLLTLLDAAWGRLEEELVTRWREPETRKVWVDHLLAEALRQLPAGRWSIVPPPFWSIREQREVEERLVARLGEPPQILPNAKVRAGLRITYGATSLDGTLEGLLSGRKGVEARLLALLSEVETP